MHDLQAPCAGANSPSRQADRMLSWGSFHGSFLDDAVAVSQRPPSEQGRVSTDVEPVRQPLMGIQENAQQEVRSSQPTGACSACFLDLPDLPSCFLLVLPAQCRLDALLKEPSRRLARLSAALLPTC